MLQRTRVEDLNGGRVVFISATHLWRNKNYTKVPESVMKDAVFFFGSKRCWVFPSNQEERRESSMQPTRYADMEQEFLDLILEKERAGLVYWLKPDCDYIKVSKYFESLVDPVTGEHYRPLILDDTFWQKQYNPSTSRVARYGPPGGMVILNYADGSHDYPATMELLAQSNPNLHPRLAWA